jgi:hypothetical protein
MLEPDITGLRGMGGALRKLGRITLGVMVSGALMVGCAAGTDSAVGPQASAPSAGGWVPPGGPNLPINLPWPLNQGPPPPYFVCQGNGGPYTGSAVIGPLGGQVTFGPHALIVPPAALLTPTTITATTLPGDTIAVVLQPQGLRFILPATLELSYAQCQNQPNGSLTLVYVSDDLRWLLELINSINLPGQHEVTGLITHFSVYAAAE